MLGGAFGEGIDLPGSRLIGAFIATLGLAGFSPENEALKQRLAQWLESDARRRVERHSTDDAKEERDDEAGPLPLSSSL
ncbi:hypothetical protein ACU8V3_14995 [Cobetia marina]